MIVKMIQNLEMKMESQINSLENLCDMSCSGTCFLVFVISFVPLKTQYSVPIFTWE